MVVAGPMAKDDPAPASTDSGAGTRVCAPSVASGVAAGARTGAETGGRAGAHAELAHASMSANARDGAERWLSTREDIMARDW